MEATSSLLSSSSTYTHFSSSFKSRSPNQFSYTNPFLIFFPTAAAAKSSDIFLRTKSYNLPRTSALAVDEEILDKSSYGDVVEKSSPASAFPKIDKSGRFCSPRAARELALSIIYAACLEGSDPIQLFERRLNARREVEYEFNRTALVEYNHMSFGGTPVTARTIEEAEELQRIDEKASEIEAEVLSAPPKLVYSKLMLRFTRKLLVAVVEKWDSNALVIEKVTPPNWKTQPAGRILEFAILHLAMSEIVVLGTRHQIVINEAVDLAKRFCDGVAPRVINGCLRTFVKDTEGTSVTKLNLKHKVSNVS